MRLFRLDRHGPDLTGRVLPAVALSAALAGCGSGQASSTLPGDAALVMDAHLRNVEAAAIRHDRAGATREIDAFAADVARQDAAGRLSRADRAALEAGIGRARARIGAEVGSPPPAPVVTIPVTPAPATPSAGGDGGGGGKVKGDGGRQNGKGNGKGGNGNGDGGD